MLLSMVESNHPDLSSQTGWEDEDCQVAYIGGLLWAAAHDESDLASLQSRLYGAQVARAAKRERYVNC
jgi:hypothetical protein